MQNANSSSNSSELHGLADYNLPVFVEIDGTVGDGGVNGAIDRALVSAIVEESG